MDAKTETPTSGEAQASHDNPAVRIHNASDGMSLDALILEQMADAVIYADRNGIIQRWNRAAESVFGFSAAEAIGQGLDLIIPERLRAAHWRGFDAAINSGATRLEGRATITRGLHKSGTTLYVEMSFALVTDAAGAVLGSVAAARDVTDRVNKEKAAASRGSQTSPKT